MFEIDGFVEKPGPVTTSLGPVKAPMPLRDTPHHENGPSHASGYDRTEPEPASGLPFFGAHSPW
jgi:hypothetical protein